MRMGIFNLVQKKEEEPVVKEVVKYNRRLRRLKHKRKKLLAMNESVNKIDIEINEIKKDRKKHIDKIHSYRKKHKKHKKTNKGITHGRQ